MDRGWGRIGWLYALGVLAAAQLGKMSALVPLITVEFAIGLTVAGVLISLLEIGGATLGFVAGLFVDRLGVRRVLLTGLGVFAVAGLGESVAASVPALIGLRLLEAFAYLCVVVAAPLLIFRSAPAGQAAVALALWSSFVPVGFALGATTSGWIADAASWRAATVVWAAMAALMLLLTLRMAIPRAASADGGTTRRGLSFPRRSIWALTMAFGCYASFAVGLIALLPT
ncbi:MAG: MFS transporter, partial [Burkholderiaceae bacterium]